MTALLIETVLAHKSALPKDSVVNTWCFATPSVAYDNSEALTVCADLTAFYTTIAAPATESLDKYLGPTISRTALAHKHKVYDLTGHLDGTPHGSPKSTVNFTIGAGRSTVALPSEVAVALSFHAGYGDDAEFAPGARPRMRDRGRVFIGPLVTSAGQELGTENTERPTAIFRDLLTAAAARLMAAPGHAWSVWSRVNGSIEPVVGGWVDDSYDTIRRRGEKPTVRSVWGSAS